MRKLVIGAAVVALLGASGTALVLTRSESPPEVATGGGPAAEAYRASVFPLAESLFDVVQPLHSALEAHRRGRGLESAVVIEDVVRRSGLATALERSRAAVAALVAPSDLLPIHRRLLEAHVVYQGVVVSFGRLKTVDPARLPAADFSDAGFIELFDQVRAAADIWVPAIAELFDGDLVPVTMTFADSVPDRPARSKVAYLATTGGVCVGPQGFEDLKDIKEPAERQLALGRNIALLQSQIVALMRVEPPVADQPLLQRRVIEPLEKFRELLDAGPRLLQAVADNDRVAARKAQKVYESAGPFARRAGRGLSEYGSRSCSLFLQELG